MHAVDDDWKDVFSGENTASFILDLDGVELWRVSVLLGRHSTQSFTSYWLPEDTILTVCRRKVWVAEVKINLINISLNLIITIPISEKQCIII